MQLVCGDLCADFAKSDAAATAAVVAREIDPHRSLLSVIWNTQQAAGLLIVVTSNSLVSC